MKTGRILCVTSTFPRWSGDSTAPFVLHLAQDLQALGWQVDVLAPHAPGAATTEVLDGVSVERFRYLWPASQQTVCYQGGALVNLRRRPSEGLKLPALVAAELLALARRLATRRYDILHSHWLLPQGVVGQLSHTIGRVPHVTTVHGGDLFGLNSPLMRAFKRFVLQRADAVTVNSSFTEQGVRALVPAPRQLRRIPMGVVTAALSAGQREQSAVLRARYRRDPGPLLIFVARLVEEKGAGDLIDATAELRAAYPAITTVILGDGPERSALERRVKALHLDNCVHFPGWVAPADLGSWLAAADIFVGPSRTAANGQVEAQGLTFLEAQVAGLPVIGTRLGGIPDAVIHEQTGLLVDERAPHQIATAVRRLLKEPWLAQRLAEQGKAHALMHFSRAASARAFSALFDDVRSVR
ncbi:glycosyltransferase [Rhabdochromatium marinum]|uniref:glycosyltransferase n=1 Tax=Rhabdochromatium marinum TaxID=48729 RepID=UPI001907F4B6|nr:glycosyltransferase [Rhabdochromatium marinum]MBK1649797.1 glycosyl transferase family 1 [Rhabdochromatium marinum]